MTTFILIIIQYCHFVQDYTNSLMDLKISAALIVLATVVFVFGGSLQILPYLIVSFRRIVRYIRNRRMRNKEFRSYRSSLKHLIGKNNFAYNKRMR